MAALCRHLPRRLAKTHSAPLGSAWHLERNLPTISGTWSGGCVDENTCVNVGRGRELSGSLGGSSFHANAIIPLDLSKVFDPRFDWSCCSNRERCLATFKSTAEHQNFLSHGSNIRVNSTLRRTLSRACYSNFSPYYIRSVWTAVSAEDKLRPEVEDEENSEGSEDNLERTDEKKRHTDAKEEEIAESSSSIYTSAKGPSHFIPSDINKFFNLSSQDHEQYFGEGLPSGLLTEFNETKENAFLIRARVLQLFERFQKCLADSVRLKEQKEQGDRVRTFPSKPRQCLLEGFVKGGKSAALAMLVHWARMQGWLVFYVPNGREWTSVGMYSKNAQTGLFDTPLQAKTALEGFLKSHQTLLGKIPCRIMKPIQLGEGAGMGKVRGSQVATMPEGATLRDLVERGLSQMQAAVSCVVRLREEFNLVQDVPVLIAIDEFNTWFTFSSFHESTGTRSRRPIHAHELSMVNAFRPMDGPLMMATAFSQSVAVGKLPVHLPGVPKGVRFSIPRYNLEETTAALKYYHSRKVTHKEPTEEDIKKLFYLTNGNGEELRFLVRML